MNFENQRSDNFTVEDQENSYQRYLSKKMLHIGFKKSLQLLTPVRG